MDPIAAAVAEPEIPAGEEIIEEPTPETPETTPGVTSSEEPTPETPETPAEIDPRDQRIQALEETLAEIREQMKPKGEQPVTQPAVTEPTAEWYEERTRAFGFSSQKVKNAEGREEEITSLNHRQFVKELMNFGREILGMARQHTDTTLHSNVSDMRFEAILSDMERKTPDIRKHGAAIKEYLKKRYAPKDQANPDFIMDGYIWARGNAAIRGTGPAKPGVKVRVVSPAKPGVKPAGGTALTQGERQMIADGTFKDEAELRAWKKADLTKL